MAAAQAGDLKADDSTVVSLSAGTLFEKGRVTAVASDPGLIFRWLFSQHNVFPVFFCNRLFKETLYTPTLIHGFPSQCGSHSIKRFWNIDCVYFRDQIRFWLEKEILKNKVNT